MTPTATSRAAARRPRRTEPVLIGLAALAAASALMWGFATSADLPGLLALAFVALLTAYLARRHPRVAKPLLVACMLRIGLSLVQAYVTPLPDSGADALAMEGIGWRLSQIPFEAALEKVPEKGDTAYAVMIATVYRATGRCSLAIQAISVLCGVLTVLEVYRLGSLLWGPSRGLAAAWAITLFPTAALYSSLTLREPIVAYLGVRGTRSIVAFVESQSLAAALVAILCYIAAGTLHSGFTLLVGVVVAAGMLSQGRSGRQGSRVARLAAGAIGVTVIVAVFSTGWGLDKFNRVLNEGSPEVFSSYAAPSMRGGSYYGSEGRTETWGDVLAQAPIRVAQFLFAPFPWMIRSPHHVIGVLDAVFYIVCVSLIILRRRVLWANRAARPVLVACAILSVVYAFGTINFGTAIRHRYKQAPMLVALAMLPGGRRRTGPDGGSGSSGAPLQRPSEGPAPQPAGNALQADGDPWSLDHGPEGDSATARGRPDAPYTQPPAKSS